MKKTISVLLIILLAALFAIGCTTATYRTDSDYVGFVSDDGIKTVKQEKKLNGNDMSNTYDDEFIYDEDGDLVQHIQTEYYDQGDDYATWEVTYQKINGIVLPETVAVNDSVFIEVEYELLESDNEGIITEYTDPPSFYRTVSIPFLLQNETSSWKVDIEKFDVPFKTDGQFVTSKQEYSFYSGLSRDNVLTLGYDNIVLKRFYYSPSQQEAGIFSESSYSPTPRDTTFTYEWEVIGGKLVQPSMTVKVNKESGFINIYVNREFDGTGRRIKEVWSAKDSVNPEKEVVIFKQELSY
jgi:hypothetical protein